MKLDDGKILHILRLVKKYNYCKNLCEYNLYIHNSFAEVERLYIKAFLSRFDLFVSGVFQWKVYSYKKMEARFLYRPLI